MPSSKVKIPLDFARTVAERLVQWLEPGTERIEIAGSVRRESQTVGDIEICCVEKFSSGLFAGQGGESVLRDAIDRMIDAGIMKHGNKDGPKYKKFELACSEGLCLDLFIHEPKQWGVGFAIRTGPWEYSRAIVSDRQKIKGGLLDPGLKIHEVQVWKDRLLDKYDKVIHEGTPLSTPEERDFLELAGGWVDPHLRFKWGT